MSKLVIGYKNLTPTGTVTTDGEDASFPAINVQESDPALAWHADTVGRFLKVDYGAIPSEALEIFAAIGTNRVFDDPVNAKYRVRTSPNTNMTSPVGDSDYIFDTMLSNPLEYAGPFGRDLIWIPGSDVKARYASQEFYDPSNPDGYVKVGLWWMGPVWSPATGKGFTWRDDTEYIAGKARKKFALSWRHLPRTEAAVFKSILHKLAQTGRVYMVLQDEDLPRWHLEAMLCTIGQVQETPVDDYVQLSCVATEADY